MLFPEDDMRELVLESIDENLTEILRVLDEELESAGCDIDTRYEIDIAVEEIFVNISDYAYGGSPGPVRIQIEIDEGVTVTFIDEGVEFDPLKRADPDITLPEKERSVGGLGIYIVKKSMDEMTYRYDEGRNILTIRKKWRS